MIIPPESWSQYVAQNGVHIPFDIYTENDKIFILRNVNEETGGNPKVQIGDFEQMLTLPNSGLRIRIPLFFEEMNVDFENPEKGIVPDFFQRNNISQEIKREDHILEWTLHYIQAEKH